MCKRPSIRCLEGSGAKEDADDSDKQDGGVGRTVFDDEEKEDDAGSSSSK